ncbi:MAG TPA: LLM class flavin-dependent oxidoreductase [Pseudonocardiaceae bacterium]|jgi:alkanesulfonate monooxygenase SsuD/methylene tetrahydromethanopterin reductase-like flavin-dependent oxidoreductase (luciferase family)|nr:LLM class flavin-dependent oxidoreductase [Pseudonocardiaceae bacterium]
MPTDAKRLAVMFDRERPTTELAGFARELDAAGVDDLWVVEDLTWAGSIATAATALALTERLRVGIGVAPAPFRNPALLAMELAALAELHPNRLIAGIGHGVPSWMAQVGAKVASPLTLMEETVVATRRLLAGETVTSEGRYVHISDVRLVHRPPVPPKVVTGVVRPKSLRLSGRVADGTVLAEGIGPDGIRASLAHIAEGRAERTDEAAHELIVFIDLLVDGSAEFVAKVRAERAGMYDLAPEQVTVAAGSSEEVAGTLAQLWAAGTDTVVLRPRGSDPSGDVATVLSALGRS